MGQVSLGQAGNDLCFVATLYQPGTFWGGTLLDRDNLAIAVFLVSEASMSQPKLSKVLENPDSTDDYLHQCQLNCSVANAIALLATGFHLDEEAARRIEEYQIPDTTVKRVREDVRRLHAEYHEEFGNWLRERKPGAEQPVPVWLK